MILCSLLLLILLLLFPEAALAGSKYGVALWLSELLPTLLPFFIAIYLFQESMPKASAHRATLLLGLLCGYPTGAALVTEQYKRGLLSPQKAYFYLGFVNNPSPMFILAFCGTNVLHMNYRETLLLFILVVLAGFLGSCLCSLLFYHCSFPAPLSFLSEEVVQKSKQTISKRIDTIILRSFILMVKIGGYVILFSILGQLLTPFIPLQSSSGIICLGTLEITCGISYLKIAPIALAQKKVLTAILLTFGGLSAAAQTSSVLTQSELSIIPYVINKFVNAVIAGILGYLLFCIF